jgi:hypothetical protein
MKMLLYDGLPDIRKEELFGNIGRPTSTGLLIVKPSVLPRK